MLEVQNSLQAYAVTQIHFNPYAEEVWVLALNSQLQLLGKEMLFKGTVDSCPLHPRDIFRYLIMKNASACILVHNHPSNSVHPSIQDIQVTRKMQRLSQLMEIDLLDHLIIGSERYYSMADFGFFKRTFTEKSRHRYQKCSSGPKDCE